MSRWILMVSAGVGPTEVRQFVALLGPELARRCEEVGLQVVSTATHGDDGSPRSIEIELRGDAPTRLSDLTGTHVLVSRSQRRGRRSRKRWFAGVSLHKGPPAPTRTVVADSDLEISAARAGGPGGQHVNTTASAVRVRHLPTGITVRASSERSQHQNRRLALARLDALLAERAASHTDAATRTRRLAHYRFERGSAVRTWTIDRRGLRPA